MIYYQTFENIIYNVFVQLKNVLQMKKKGQLQNSIKMLLVFIEAAVFFLCSTKMK